MSENNSKGTSNGQEQTNGPITNGNSLYNAPGDDKIYNYIQFHEKNTKIFLETKTIRYIFFS